MRPKAERGRGLRLGHQTTALGLGKVVGEGSLLQWAGGLRVSSGREVPEAHPDQQGRDPGAGHPTDH